MNLLWAHYFLCEVTIYSLFDREHTLNSLLLFRAIWIQKFHANQLRIHNIFPKVTMKSLWIHYLFREFTVNSLFFREFIWTHYLFQEFTMNLHSFSCNHYEFCVCFAKSLWIHYFFQETTMNSMSIFSRIHVNSLSFSLIVREHTFDSLSFLPVNFEFTKFFVKSLWIQYVFSVFTSIIFYANQLRIHNFSPKLPYIHFDFTICLTNILIISIFGDFTICSTNILWIRYFYYYF